MPRFLPRTLLLGGILVVMLAAVYARSLHGAFLWDDDLHITENPTIVGPLGLKEIWTTARANYFPLVLTNFWAQHAAWELNPFGYRAVTLAFHIAAALLLWHVLLQLRVPGAWLGAALWALHPVQVESVAWICELKNTQSAVFFLLAIACWIRWLNGLAEAGKFDRFYLAALAGAVLALLSKPSTVMLPVALGLCGWWVQRRVVWREVWALAPFLALSAIVAGWTVWEQKFHSGAIGPEWSQSVPERFAIAGRALWFYLGKLLWPEPLMFVYPRWDLAHGWGLSLAALAGMAALAALLWWRGREARVRPLFFATAYFVALLFPVLGFFSVYFFRYSFVGDHFQYLASMGPLALTGALLARVSPRVQFIAGGALLLALALATSRHSLVFRSNEILWRDTVAKNPGAAMAWLNLADALAENARHDEAVATLRHALSLEPDNPPALNDLGYELILIGQPFDAIPHLERSLALRPNHADTLNNLGRALGDTGRTAEAIAHYRHALEIDPTLLHALNNLGVELAEAGRSEEAITLFERAHRLKPNDAASLDNLGSALRGLGRFDEAIARHQQALKLAPDFPEAHVNLGRTLVAAGRVQEALALFERALQLRPLGSEIRGHYAAALMAIGRSAEAMQQLRIAVERSPESPEAHLNLGSALAQSGQALNALPHFERAIQLSPKFAAAHVNLGLAQAELRRWGAAAAAFGTAVELEPESGATRAQLAIALVNSGQPETAVEHFKAAIRQQPTAELHNQFAQVLRSLGRNREALEQFELAMKAPR